MTGLGQGSGFLYCKFPGTLVKILISAGSYLGQEIREIRSSSKEISGLGLRLTTLRDYRAFDRGSGCFVNPRPCYVRGLGLIKCRDGVGCRA